MAYQIPPSSGFGAGYPIPPYYPSFVQNPPQHLSNLQQGYQQPHAQHANTLTSTSRSNDMRFDANAHGTPQPPSLPYPPSLNPEMFKHFPPPPPPPSGFSAGPGTPTNFHQFSQTLGNASQAYGQHNFPPFPQPHTSLNGAPFQSQGSGPSVVSHGTPFGQGFNHTANKVTQDFRHGTSSDIRSPAVGFTMHDRPSSPSLTHSYDGASLSALVPQRGMFTDPVNGQSTESQHDIPKEGAPVAMKQDATSLLPHNRPPSTTQIQSGEVKSQSSLRDSAKAAILSLLPHKIVYNDLLAEGVDAHVLQKLYTELGLNWKNTEDSLEKSNGHNDLRNKEETTNPEQKHSAMQSDSLLRPPVPHVVANASVKPTQGLSSAARTASMTSSGLERKDRIAQLLAAKTGKIGTLVGASQSGSPVSVAESTVAHPPLSRNSTPASESQNPSTVQSTKLVKPMPQTELVRQKMEQLRRAAAESLQASIAPVTVVAAPGGVGMTDATRSQLASLPTPVRESLVRESLSSMIPGLFMTSADEEAPDDDMMLSSSTQADSFPLPVLGQEQPTDQPKSPPVTSDRLKRAAGSDLAEDDSRSAKRRASSRVESVGTAMDIDDPTEDAVSEGEIVEDGDAPNRINILEEGSMSDPRCNDEIPQSIHIASTQSSEIENASAQAQNVVPSLQPSKQIPQPQPDHLPYTEHTNGNHVTHNLNDSPVNSGPVTTAATQIQQGIITSSSSSVLGTEITPSGKRAAVSPRPLVKLKPAQFAERAAQLKADFMRQRAMRQKQLVEGMPALNDEVVKTQQRLEEHKTKLTDVRHKIETLRADVVRALEIETQMLGDIAQLEKQVRDGVSGQTQFSKELREIKQQEEEDLTPLQSLVGSQPSQIQPPLSVNTSKLLLDQSSTQPGTQAPALTGYHQPEQVASNLVQSKVSQHNTDNEVDMPKNVQKLIERQDEAQALHSQEQQSHVADESDSSLVTDDTEENENLISDQARTNTFHNAKEIQGNQGKQRDTEYQEDDSDDDEPMDQSEDESEGTHMSVDQESDGSASMSDSGSDDYQPPEPKFQPLQEPQIADPDDYEPSESQQTLKHTDLHDTADGYEPSDVIVNEETTSKQPSDVALTSNPSPTLTSTQHHQNGTSAAISEVIQESTTDDQEKGLQLSEANTLIKPQDTADDIDPDARILSGGETSSFARFIPYQSPLSSFKSYRFHPSFADQIKNGYRSLTYSNKIDPKKPICPRELEGAACTDPECEEQHFGSMALTDDKILVQMSSAIDIKDKTSRDKYLIGLKQVIARLRQEGVKEFPLVADALSKYRRDWTAKQPVQ